MSNKSLFPIRSMTFNPAKDLIALYFLQASSMSPMKSRSSSRDLNEDSVKRDQRSSSVPDEDKSEIKRTIVSRSRSISKSRSRSRRRSSSRRDRSRSRSRSGRRSRSRSRGRRSYRSRSRSPRRSRSEEGYRLHIGGNYKS